MHLLPILCILPLVNLAIGNSINSDVDALLKFRKGITKDPLGHVLDSWDHFTSTSEGCPLNWYGIQCNTNRVTSISLSNIGLEGKISLSFLAPMDMLRNLTLANNQLTGTLTPDLGSITSLEYLDLSRNLFSGHIPTELIDLGSLVYINLSSNRFEGSLPSGFNKLQNLKYLDLQGNGFLGDAGDILGQLQSAVYVDLSQNRFTGALSSITDNSSITGSLQYLNISHNDLSGQLFGKDIVPLFDSLEVFDSSYNQLSAQIPSFNFIASLKVLRLGNNRFFGSFPEALFKGFSMVLTELDLSCNELTGPLLSITSTTLKKLNLSTNKLSGPLPTKIGSCTAVDLSNNLFSEDISGLQSWGSYVEAIDLSSNKLKGTLQNETSQFSRLKSLRLSNNLLEGEVPLVIGTYPDLIVIDLSSNHLHGPLPPSLFTSTSLMELNLSSNNLTGSIVLNNSNAKSDLVSVDLSNNLLSGSLPQGMNTMKQLKLLNLAQNHFEGNLPDDLPNGLTSFNVSSNDFSGNVPTNLLRFPDSSFHPGNSLLIFPSNLSNVGTVKRKPKHHWRRKNLIIYGLIAGAFICATLFLLFILIYHKISPKNDRRDANQRKKLSISWFLRSRKSIDQQPPTCSSLSQDQLIQTSLPARAEQRNISSTSTSVSQFLSSPPSSHRNSSQHPNILSVYSPDRLAGDLHLFDNSPGFTLEELSRAPAEIIGRSCHGTSYKANLDKGQVLVVKWLKEGIAKSKKEFSREVKKLGTFKHPNLVSLKGYYWGPKEHEKLLISDCVDALSLTVHLCESEQRMFRPLTLSQRLIIASDVARCLTYLHNEKSIPHGNLKPTNIIVQPPNMNALLTDYSLHRIMTPSGMAEQVLNAGALGYRPPEFASTSKPCPSLKSDVYAFGVILLEVLTGRSAGEIVYGDPGVVDLTDWVRSLSSSNCSHECFDKKMVVEEESSNGNSLKLMEELLGVALRCIKAADERPEIKTVFNDISSLLL